MSGERSFTVQVAADAEGLVPRAGAASVAQEGDRLRLTRALSPGLAAIKQRRRGHTLGRVIRYLAVMLADGGECVAARARRVRGQRALFGPVASDSTAFRVIGRIASGRLLDELRRGRGCARALLEALRWAGAVRSTSTRL
jgi:hypothetical protein